MLLVFFLLEVLLRYVSDCDSVFTYSKQADRYHCTI